MPWLGMAGKFFRRDLLNSEWWHHDKAECHYFAVAGKEIGHEMADSWTGLHDIKAPKPCHNFNSAEQTSDRCLCISDLCAPVGEKNSFIRCQSFVLTIRESAFNILGNIFLNIANAVAALRCLFSRWLLQFCQLNIICKVHNKIIFASLYFWKYLFNFFCLVFHENRLFFKQNISKYPNDFTVDVSWSLIIKINDLLIGILQELYSSGTVDVFLLYPEAKPMS